MKSTVSRKRRNAVSRGIERICSHNIEWRLEGKGLQLWDMDNLIHYLLSQSLGKSWRVCQKSRQSRCPSGFVAVLCSEKSGNT